MCGQEYCDSYRCQWNATAPTPFCGQYTCGNFSGNATACNRMGRHQGCDYHKETSTCSSSYGNFGRHMSWGMQARETAENLMAGHWFSTQRQGHCNGTEPDKECSWRVAAVDKVANASCVNGKIVAEVEKVNASCFAALPDGGKNKTTDGFITCFFESLFGNSSTGAPALDGNRLQTLDDAATLRNKIESLWLGAFESDDPADGGCAPAASHNVPDPSGTPRPSDIEALTLYVRGSKPATSLVNRNSGDAGAIVLQALLCDDGDCSLPEALRAPGQRGAVLTQVSAQINTLTGQYAECANNGTAWSCAAKWECWCDSYDNNDGGNPCDGHDDRRVCPCKIWGGCGGGQWPVNSDDSIAVGRRSLKSAEGLPAELAAVAAASNEYSTTAGGQCASDAADGDVCTWAASAGPWVSADADCVEAAVRQAVQAAQAVGQAAAAAGEAALGLAFAPGSACLLGDSAAQG